MLQRLRIYTAQIAGDPSFNCEGRFIRPSDSALIEFVVDGKAMTGHLNYAAKNAGETNFVLVGDAVGASGVSGRVGAILSDSSNNDM